MARTHAKVRFLPKGKQKHTEVSAAEGVEEVLRILEGRWKLVILFHLFGGKVRRFSELRRAIPAVSEKMLIQQLRQMERAGVVRRFVHHQVPPKVEYSLTSWGRTSVHRMVDAEAHCKAFQIRFTTPIEFHFEFHLRAEAAELTARLVG